MSALLERTVRVNDCECRLWEARVWAANDAEASGGGLPLVYLGGPFGVPHWTPFLERLAERRHVIVPSLPGFPGATGHDRLDHLIDWIAATLDLLEAAGVERADLVGASLGGLLAAELAGFTRSLVRRLALIAPLGIYAAEEPVADLWALPPSAPNLVTQDPGAFAALLARPEGTDAGEWPIVAARAREASARLLWPCCDVGLARRLHRIRAPTMLLWGGADRVIPASYALRFAERLSAPVKIERIEGAGHLADLDRPADCAAAILDFFSESPR
jgi:pimeloyl-ACP methyl ester carboxylesterase